jgi:hypothetical protein
MLKICLLLELALAILNKIKMCKNNETADKRIFLNNV